MGRTGRRGGVAPNCTFLTTSPAATVQAAALLHLHAQGYVEPVEPSRRAAHILAHQILALAIQHQGIPEVDLWPPGSRWGHMVLLVLLVRQHAEHDHQKCPHTIEQQYVESIELNKDDHAHDEDQQTNGRAGLNTGPVSAADPNHAPETNAQRQEHIVDHDQPKNPHVGLMLHPKLTELARLREDAEADGSTLDRVRAAIRECLPGGEVSIDAAAQRLRVGRRAPPRRRAPPGPGPRR